MTDALISALLQLLIFSLVPWLTWMAWARRKNPETGFREYLGLKGAPQRACLLAVLYSAALAIPLITLVVFSDNLMAVMTHPDSVTGSLRAMGFGPEALGIMLVTALVKTALAEEIFFRGFIAKRLIAWLGFDAGNLLQALLFGALHSALFYTISNNILLLLVIFLFPGAGAWIKGYLNEKLAGGSIVPGWIMHACSNLASYTIIGFVL